MKQQLHDLDLAEFLKLIKRGTSFLGAKLSLFKSIRQARNFVMVFSIVSFTTQAMAGSRIYAPVSQATDVTNPLPAASNASGVMSYTPVATLTPAPVSVPKSNTDWTPFIGLALMGGMTYLTTNKNKDKDKSKSNASGSGNGGSVSDSSGGGGQASKPRSGSDAAANPEKSTPLAASQDAAGSGSIARGLACKPASGFQPPVKDPRVTSCFGNPRGGKNGSYAHKGLDYASGAKVGGSGGAEVKAVSNGKIRVAAQMGGRSGHTIIMDHDSCPSGLHQSQCVSVYRHLDTKMAGPGNCYAGGNVIGRVGRKNVAINGGVDPHLHLEIIANGLAFNPANYSELTPSPGKCQGKGPRTLSSEGVKKVTNGRSAASQR